MRVWLCPSAFAPHRGGVEELTLKLAQQLQRSGHEVLVVTNRHPSSLSAVDEVEGVEVHRVPFTLPARRPDGVVRHLLARRGVRTILDDLARPDLVHVVCMSSQTAALTAYAGRHRLPLVLTTQGETAMDAQGIYQRNPWLRRDLRRASQQAVALTACSAWTRDHAATVAPRFAQARVVLNGVDPEDWSTGAVPSEPVFGAWGRHVREKGFDLLLEAFALVRRQVPAAQLLLGGDGPERTGLPVVEGVSLLGSLDRAGVRSLLERTRVAVVPSRVEPFGIVALEALAAGRGLVYSSSGGLSEAAGACGRAADPQDPDALAAAMLAELAEPTPSEAGRRRAHECSWQSIAAQYEDVYDTAVRA